MQIKAEFSPPPEPPAFDLDPGNLKSEIEASTDLPDAKPELFDQGELRNIKSERSPSPPNINPYIRVRKIPPVQGRASTFPATSAISARRRLNKAAGAQKHQVSLEETVDTSLANRPPAGPPVIHSPVRRNTASGMIRQPHAQQISLEQLAAEIKAIYHGLCVVETKLFLVISEWNERIDEMVKNGVTPDGKDDKWPTFIGLTRTYLHEHNDFFLASQHPVASPVLQDLAAKYNMPARLWKWVSFLPEIRVSFEANISPRVSILRWSSCEGACLVLVIG